VKALQHKPNGFTLLELIVVIAGLGILSSLAIPNFIKYLEFAQIDEAKVLLNTAAAQCLQEFRKHGWVVAKDIKPDALPALADEGEQSKLPGRYVFKDGNNKCEHIVIEDPAGSDSIFPLLGLKMTSQGKIVKYAAPGNRDSISAAESWGETSISEELLAEINYLGQCTVNQSECNTAFTNALKIASDGPLSVKAWQGKCEWPADPTCGCLRDVWACDKRAYYKQDDYESCIRAKATAECNQHMDGLKASLFTGLDSADKCPTQNWWLEGVLIGEDEADFNKAKCELEKKNKAKVTGSGKFEACNQTHYACEGNVVDKTKYYQKGGCGYDPPKKCKNTLNAVDPDCKEWEEAMVPFKERPCDVRPSYPDPSREERFAEPNHCRQVGRGKPSSSGGWDKTPECGAWATCMELR